MSVHTHTYIISPYLLFFFLYIQIRTTQYVLYIRIIYSYGGGGRRGGSALLCTNSKSL